VIAATPEGARLVPAAPAMLTMLGHAADELKGDSDPEQRA
jgi:DNA-binding transcriptional LysR family regulator